MKIFECIELQLLITLLRSIPLTKSYSLLDTTTKLLDLYVNLHGAGNCMDISVAQLAM